MTAHKILVLNGPSYAGPVKGLGEIVTVGQHDFISYPEKYKLILFTGGADISPGYYGDSSPNGLCMSNPNRDVYEKQVFLTAFKRQIPMAGICRGLQFINVMAGGKMIHHLAGHEGGLMHLIETVTGIETHVNSLHHQAVLLPDEARVFAWSKNRLAGAYYGNRDAEFDYKGLEIEAAIYPKQRAFGVQWHPEYMSKGFEGFDLFRRMVIDIMDLPMDKFVEKYTGTGNDTVHQSAGSLQ